jgi:hypothetical protein
LGLFWFAAALLGAALIFAGCETEADEKIVYLPGEMIHLDVVVENVTDLATALADDEVLAIGFDGNSGTNVLTETLTILDGKVVYILNGGTLKTGASNADLIVEGIVYVGIGGTLDVSDGKVIVDGGQVSVLPAKSIAAIAAGVPPGTLKVADADSVINNATPPATALGGDNVWIGGALEFTTPTEALINTAFTDYVKTGGTVNVDADVTVADTETVTVPAGKILNVAADLTLDAGAELVATGTVNVAATGSLVLTAAASAGGAKISGAGGVNAGATTITGAWQAVGTGTVTIEENKITASATTAVLTGGTGGVINVTADTLTVVGTIDITTAGTVTLTGDATTAGSLLLKGGTIPGLLVVDSTKTTTVNLASLNTTNFFLTDSSGTAAKKALVTKDGSVVAAATVVVKGAAADASTGTDLGSIGGGGTADTLDAQITGQAVAANASAISKTWKVTAPNS